MYGRLSDVMLYNMSADFFIDTQGANDLLAAFSSKHAGMVLLKDPQTIKQTLDEVSQKGSFSALKLTPKALKEMFGLPPPHCLETTCEFVIARPLYPPQPCDSGFRNNSPKGRDQ